VTRAGGAAFDDASSTALVAGGPGGAANDGSTAASGLAVQLIARDSIEVGAGIALSVSGEGRFSAANQGAPGGGAGGTLLLEAPSVTIRGELRAEGGFGGSLSVKGSDGTVAAHDAFFGEESGAGGAGKLLINADQLDIANASLSPSPTTAPSCARLGALTPL
jgi:hypothetical protein